MIELNPPGPDDETARVAGPGNSTESEPEAPRRARVVRYGAMGYVGEFGCKPGLVFGCGARVVVQTERGIELGDPVGVPCAGGGCELTAPRPQLQSYIKTSGTEFCKPRAGRILRVATEQDIREHNHLNAHLREDVDHCAELAYRLSIDVKIVTAEHLLGGERIVFYFAAPTRVDFRQLVKELAQRYRTRIEMRQVGARDEARLVGDYEVCGRECCCRNFLKKLRPVNMKMAKLQKSTLDPSKVSGRCGRLRCCLRYEHYGYEELAKRLPRVGSRVDTEFGPATVLDRQVLTQLVSVRTDNDRVVAIPLEEVKAFDLPPLPRPPPPEPAASGTAPAPAERAERPRRGRQRGRGRGAPFPGAERSGAPGTPPTSAEESKFVAEPASGPSEAPPPSAADVAATAAADADRTPDSAAGQPTPAAGEALRRRRRRHRRRGRGGEPTPPASEGATGS